MASEQTLSDKVRDGELKDIKIESLENIIKKREQTLLKNNAQSASQSTKKNTKEMAAKIEKLEQIKNKLESEKNQLLDENEKLQQ